MNYSIRNPVTRDNSSNSRPDSYQLGSSALSPGRSVASKLLSSSEDLTDLEVSRENDLSEHVPTMYLCHTMVGKLSTTVDITFRPTEDGLIVILSLVECHFTPLALLLDIVVANAFRCLVCLQDFSAAPSTKGGRERFFYFQEDDAMLFEFMDTDASDDDTFYDSSRHSRNVEDDGR